MKRERMTGTTGCAVAVACLLLASCRQADMQYDASGVFESTEVIVSAEADGKILRLDVEEGDRLSRGQEVGCIDTVPLSLQRGQLLASARAVGEKRSDVEKQVAATRRQIGLAETERDRAAALLADNAGTRQQLDNAEAQLAVLRRQLEAQLSTLRSGNRSLASEEESVDYQVAALDDRLRKCRVRSPIAGTVLTKYAEAGEVTGPGQPLFKLADMKRLFLRAYVTGNQLAGLRLGQRVTVYADKGGGEMRSYPGRITWISDKAEFTPKTIQTKDERANLVYAVKISVTNDGYLKLGMYGEVAFTEK